MDCDKNERVHRWENINVHARSGTEHSFVDNGIPTGVYLLYCAIWLIKIFIVDCLYCMTFFKFCLNRVVQTYFCKGVQHNPSTVKNGLPLSFVISLIMDLFYNLQQDIEWLSGCCPINIYIIYIYLYIYKYIYMKLLLSACIKYI